MLMKEISKEELLKYLFRDDIVGRGFFGIVLEYDDNTLIKLYYKNIERTYEDRNEDLLDEEIEMKKKHLEEIDGYLEYTSPIEEKKNNLLFEIGYLNAVVMYNGYKIGVLLNYYKDYQKIGLLYDKLSNDEKIIVLNNVKKYLEFLISKGIYPNDIWQDNVLVNPENLDVKIIDLDDYMTVIKYNDIVDCHRAEAVVYSSYNKMIKILSKY